MNMEASNLWLDLAATRETNRIRFSGCISNNGGCREKCTLSGRVSALGSTLVRREMAEVVADEFEVIVNGQHFSEAWAIVEVRQTVDALPERFGIALELGVETESFTAPLEPLPSELLALCYIASHGDLVSALRDDAQAGRAHYRQNGMREGRTISFRPYEYAASHQDLFELISDPIAAARHYIRKGFSEGRPIYFDAYLYAAGYPQVAEQFGLNVAALAKHYVEHGMSQGFHCENFDWQTYVEKTPEAPRSRSGAAEHFLRSVSPSSRIM